ncbi:CopG family transcriptional regulator [Candidatus Gottesmanbacteria bacterium]|nr:CopG family transcriptional regulator [Candidatus Gottesmanbacteria bacterium]MBI5452284.1 CopG family transcriptional regulator [Candidatus Gottesmanbacteria bacterium]
MIRTQVYLPEDLYRNLKLLSATSGMNFSELIREGAKVVVEKKTKKRRKFDAWKDFVGVLKGGPKDLSSNIDYYLYVEPYEKKNRKK